MINPTELQLLYNAVEERVLNYRMAHEVTWRYSSEEAKVQAAQARKAEELLELERVVRTWVIRHPSVPVEKPKRCMKECSKCGNWTCNVCGWKRLGASLKYSKHTCGRCGSDDGTMTPMKHGLQKWKQHNLPEEQWWDEDPKA